MKKIMILGGGYYQLPLIRKSVELGFYTIVCGIDGNYPGYKFASKWVNADTFDKEAILQVAKEEIIDGILLCGSDACMPTIGYVCDQLHLIGPTEQATINASNKAIMKRCFTDYGVRTANYKKIFSLSEAEAFAIDYDYNVVLKVVDASGSKGVAIVKSLDELRIDYNMVVNETKLPYIIIEEYINGEEFGAQAFVRNGNLTFVMPHGDITYHSTSDVPIGHYAPYEHSNDLIDDIKLQLKKCIESLGVDNTAINADFILHDGKVYVLEIGARAGATCLPELVSNYYGIDYYEYLLRQCLGDHVKFEPTSLNQSLVETLISEKTGVVQSINVGEIPREVVTMELYPQVGDKVTKFRNAYDRIGILVMKGTDLKRLFYISDVVKKNVIELNVV